MSDLHHCHPFEHNGISRIGRLVHALRPETFRIDERSIQDLIVEAHRFAETLRFYDESDEQPAGAYWEKLWEVEILTYLAVLSAKDTDEMLREYQQHKEDFKLAGSAKPLSGQKQQNAENQYSSLLDFLRSLALSLEEAYQKLVRIKHPLQTLLLNRIRKENRCDFEELEGALEHLISFHKGADDDLQMEKYNGFFTADKRWGISGKVEYDAIAAQPNFFLDDLEELFNSFYNTWLILKQEAQKGFDEELARMELPEDVEYRVVQPHIALFLVFLRLFRYAQDSLNELGGKHLDYYYEEILGLKRKDAVPDETYLIFELAKDFNQHLLEKGTPFLAGKDQNGKPLLFEATEDWVIRSAKVADIKTTWIDLDCKSIHANPDVKKVYENGAEKPNETAKAWRSMGDNQHLPDGEVGFAIASPQLILREGNRVVDVTLTLNESSNAAASLRPEYFQVFLSSSDTWIAPKYDEGVVLPDLANPDSELQQPELNALERSAFGMKFSPSDNELPSTIQLRVVLERDAPPVDNLGEALAAEAGFDNQWPILKVLINPLLVKPCPTDKMQNLTTAEVYEMLRTLSFKQAEIKVDVRGIKENLIFQSDQGVFDGTQKVFPFGPVPQVGNKFYLGSTEVFQKALTCLKVCFDWIAPPGSFETHYEAYAESGLGLSLPDPFMKIDFVDRADISIPKQLVRSGRRDQGESISGVVTDMNGNPLTDITVRIMDGVNEVSSKDTDAEGKYELTGIDAGQASWTIEFIAPGQDDDDPDNEPLYESLILYAEKEDEAPGAIEIEDFSNFNAVLFPKSVLFSEFSQVSGEVKDIYGAVVSGGGAISVGETVWDIDTNTDTFSSDAKGELKIYATNYKAVTPASIPLDDYTNIRIVLEPDETALPLSGGEAIDSDNPRISGIITQNKQNGGGKPNAFVEVQDGDLTIKAFSNSSGKYELPLINKNNQVRFFPDIYANSILPINTPSIAVTPANQTINAKLLAHARVEKTFFDGTIRVKVIDYKDAPISGGIQFSMLIAGSTNPVVLDDVTDLDNGEYQLSGVSGGDTELTVSGDNFETARLRIGDYSDFEVMLLPAGFVERSGNLTSGGSVTGRVFDRNGQPISGYTVSDGTTTITVEDNSPYTITPDTAPQILTFSKDGFKDFTVSIDGTNIINVFMAPEMAAPTVEDEKIEGTLQGANAASAAGIHVVLEGALNDKYIKFETTTDDDGKYKITRLNGVQDRRITCYDDDNHTVETEATESELATLFFSTRIKKSRPTRLELTGVVRDMNDNPVNGNPIKGAIIEIDGTNVKAETDKDGNYTLSGEITDSNIIKISHAAYQPLSVNVEQGCLKLDIRLIPKPVFAVVSGKVTDVLKSPVRNVAVKLVGTAIEATGDNEGNYTLDMPFDVDNGAYTPPSPQLEMSTAAGFEIKRIPINSEYPNPGESFSKSHMDIILYYRSINYAGLLDEGTFIKRCFDVNINALNLVRDVRTQHFEKYRPTLKRGFLVFKLEESDFLHTAYPQALTYYSLKEDKTDAHTLNPPYTPAVNGITLDYCSTQIITGDENNGVDQYYHLLPFNGHKWRSLKAVAPEPEVKVQLIYPYMPDDTLPPIEGGVVQPYAPGNLFVGIAELQPGGTLSLLFTVLAGSEKEPEALAPDIHWSYLAAENTWLPFPAGQVLKDSTNGLTRTGMIQFQIPFDAVSENTMLNAEYYWLRAAAVQAKDGDPVTRVQSLPSLEGITAQVIQAKFANNGNELSHLSQPLPADSISKLLQGDIAVKKVEQPLQSFGGRLPEQMGEAFMYRVSERLRHKDRGVSVWDYEHLLLEKFNKIALAKCIQHTRYKPADKASERAPGYVTIAVVPSLSSRKGEPWPEPRFTQGNLDGMQEYLTAHSNLFVAHGEKTEARLQVVNPLYERVDILVKAAFSAKDIAYAKQQLKEGLTHYISPWLADPSRPPIFGRVLEKSAILQFIEEQAYIDYVDVGERAGGFIIRKAVTDLIGRPIVFDYNSNLETEAGQDSIAVSVREVKSRFYEGKICPESERSILIAGDIVVGTLEDAIELPLMPVKLSTISRGGGRGATVASLSYSATDKKVTEQPTTKASSAKLDTTSKAKAKSSSSKRKASSTRQNTSTEAKKPSTSKKTTRKRKPKSSSKSKTSRTGKGASTQAKKKTTKKRTSNKSTTSRKKKASASKPDSGTKGPGKKDDTKA